MNQPLHDFSEPALIRAIEENTKAFLLVLGRLGGGEERDDLDIQWIIGGSPLAYHNCVVRATLTAETIDEAVVASMECLRRRTVAGSWHVGTLPEARRQGIGAAITLAALQDARRLGYHIGVLGSSSMGYQVYRRLGFQQYCRLDLYEWTP